MAEVELRQWRERRPVLHRTPSLSVPALTSATKKVPIRRHFSLFRRFLRLV